jgi:hypothetical protein
MNTLSEYMKEIFVIEISVLVRLERLMGLAHVVRAAILRVVIVLTHRFIVILVAGKITE